MRRTIAAACALVAAGWLAAVFVARAEGQQQLGVTPAQTHVHPPAPPPPPPPVSAPRTPAPAAPTLGLINSATFDDRGGDGGVGPDVTRIKASNYDNGLVVFEITTPNRPALEGSESIQLRIDTDRNAQTGNNATDFVIYALGRGRPVHIGKWNGSAFEIQRQSPQSGFASGVLTLRFAQAELSLRDSFDFRISTYRVSPGGEIVDRAPDSGHWTYRMTRTVPTTTPAATPKPSTTASGGHTQHGKTAKKKQGHRGHASTLRATGFTMQPATPRAGVVFAAGIRVYRVRAPRTPVRRGKVGCAGQIAAQPVPAYASRFLSARAAGYCYWQLPATAAGQWFTGSVAVESGGAIARRSFRLRIR